MSDSNSSADIVACIAVLVAVASGSLNLHLYAEVKRYEALTNEQTIQIQTMEKTLLLNR